MLCVLPGLPCTPCSLRPHSPGSQNCACRLLLPLLLRCWAGAGRRLAALPCCCHLAHPGRIDLGSFPAAAEPPARIMQECAGVPGPSWVLHRQIVAWVSHMGAGGRTASASLLRHAHPQRILFIWPMKAIDGPRGSDTAAVAPAFLLDGRVCEGVSRACCLDAIRWHSARRGPAAATLQAGCSHSAIHSVTASATPPSQSSPQRGELRCDN